MGTTKVLADDRSQQIALVDDCDPRDPGWAPTGGCLRKKGDVTTAEFGLFLTSPLAPMMGPRQLIGHPAWAIEPSYLKIKEDKKFRVKNEGGRRHTFTEVRDYGGGFVPPLNFGMAPAPECSNPAGLNVIDPGHRLDIKGLAAGTHKFICCIHPWMRADIKVKEKNRGDDDE